MAQSQRALKQCHDESEGFTLLIPDRARKTRRKEREKARECKPYKISLTEKTL